MLRQTGREIGVKGLSGARGETLERGETVEGLSEIAQLRPGCFMDLGQGWHMC